MNKYVYFTDQFFSSGRTDIFNESQQKIGSINLRSSFTSSVSVENELGESIVEGSFLPLSNRWVVKHSYGDELGKVKMAFTLFSKSYHYTNHSSNRFKIEAPAFSKEYMIMDENKKVVAMFQKVSGVFQAAAYELRNDSEILSTEELIAVVMGVNAIERRRRSSS